MVDMNGRTDGSIKASLKMTSEMAMESCLTLKISQFTKDSGKMDKNQEDKAFMMRVQLLNKRIH